jgi:hypothetical protein
MFPKVISDRGAKRILRRARNCLRRSIDGLSPRNSVGKHSLVEILATVKAALA